MKRFIPALIRTLASACLLGMLFSGCSAAKETVAAPGASPAADKTPAPTKAPAATPIPTPTPSPTPSPTPFSLNPVYAFYDLFEAENALHLDDYAARLSALNTADGLSYSLLLSEHRTALSEGRITVGRLYGSDAGGYSGTLSAAAPGSGTMKGSLEDGYTFRYEYNNGRLLLGSFDGRIMEFTVYEGTEPLFFCRMEKAADRWMSTAADGTTLSELTVLLFPGEGTEAVSFAKRSGNFLPPALTVSSGISEAE